MTAVDRHPVQRLVDRGAQATQLSAGGQDSVRLLHAKLGRIVDYRITVGEDAGKRQSGDLVDRAWYEVSAYFDSVQAGGSCHEVSHRLPTLRALLKNLDVGTHL